MDRDVVVMVRQGREYEELRYALRSLVNVPHSRVWVYGGRPEWLTGATHVPVQQGPVQHANTARITQAIAGNRALSDEWYWWHDDMYVLARMDVIPRLYRATWTDWAAAAPGRKGPHGPAKTTATAEALAAFGKVPEYSYELHVPMVVERAVFADMVTAVTTWRPEALIHVQKRSLYGNWASYGGRRADDVKFRIDGHLGGGWQYASSPSTALTGPAGEQIRAMFPDPSPYELPRPAVVPDTIRLMAGHLAGRTG